MKLLWRKGIIPEWWLLFKSWSANASVLVQLCWTHIYLFCCFHCCHLFSAGFEDVLCTLLWFLYSRPSLFSSHLSHCCHTQSCCRPESAHQLGSALGTAWDVDQDPVASLLDPKSHSSPFSWKCLVAKGCCKLQQWKIVVLDLICHACPLFPLFFSLSP